MSKASIFLLVAGCATLAPAQTGHQDSGQIRTVCDASAPTLREFSTKTFVLLLTLDDKGHVQTFKTDSPVGLHLEKAKAAATAIRTMKFKPAKKDGNPVAVQVKMGFDCADELTDAPEKH